MKMYVFEGSPEELSKMFPTVGLNQSSVTVVPSETVTIRTSDPRKVTVEEAVLILTRRHLSDNLRTILIALYEAGEKRLTSDDLKKVSGLNSDQFRGVFGAFGRRVANTISDEVVFIDYKWEDTLGQYTWTLPETVRQAMRDLKIVH